MIARMRKLINLIQFALTICILVLLLIALVSPSQLSPLIDREGYPIANHPISWTTPVGSDYYGIDVFQKLYTALFNNMKYAIASLISFLTFGLALGISYGFKGQENHYEYLKYYLRKRRFSVLGFKIVQNIANILLYVLQSIPVVLSVTIIIIVLQRVVPNPDLRIFVEMLFVGLFLSPKIALAVAERIENLQAEEYIRAAKGMGISRLRLIFHHILWLESRGTIILHSINLIIQAIMLEVFLSYFSYGPDAITLGNMILNDIVYLAGVFSGTDMPKSLDTIQALSPFLILLTFSLSFRWLGTKVIEMTE